MPTGRNGQAHAPSVSVVLKLLNVSDKGPITVRFLGELLSTMTHWIPGKPKGHSEVCLGPACDASLHKRKSLWKGYAAVEVWRSIEKDWYPGVLEVTEALGQQLAERTLTGELWELQRCKGEFKHPEVVGTFIHYDRPAPVNTEGWVETVCFRLYRTTEIIWGARDPLPTRVRIETRKAPPPPTIPTAVPDSPSQSKQPHKTFQEILKEKQARGEPT